MSEINRDKIEQVLEDVLEYSRDLDYVGWDKHDGMSSQIRQSLPIETKWTNLLFQEVIKRSPVNLRPLFLVKQRPNPKGLSLFTMANLNAKKITGNNFYLDEAEKLMNQVVNYNSDNYDGFCLYHNHELQGLSSKNPREKPGVVPTSYGVKALLRASSFNESYAKLARTADRFVNNELYSEQDDDGIRVGYTTGDDKEVFNLNGNAITARLYIDLYDYFGKDDFRQTGESILNYVSNKQEDIGGWKYMDPPSASHLSMDNYHNGFILESFIRHQEVVNEDKYKETIEKGLDFYRDYLYEDNGAPRWDEKNKYPQDIHAAAQGIIVFTYTDNIKFAKRIVGQMIDSLYAGEGQFYYQKKRYYTKKYTLMRWCQAWMAYSLSELIVSMDDKNHQYG